jgi:hypothetical protein
MKEQLSMIMRHYGMTATRFAESIGVPASSVSHVRSGRNKPGYDFIIKVLGKYPEINPEWLLTGAGDMLRGGSNPPSDACASTKINASTDESLEAKKEREISMPEGVNISGLEKCLTSLREQNNLNDNEKSCGFDEHAGHLGAKSAWGTLFDHQHQTNSLGSQSYVHKNKEHIYSDDCPPSRQEPKQIDYVMVFYTDRTVSIFNPEQSRRPQ